MGVSPFQSTPLELILIPDSFDISKQFTLSSFGITIYFLFAFSLISFMVWNLSFNGDFSFGKSQKTQGVKSGFSF